MNIIKFKNENREFLFESNASLHQLLSRNDLKYFSMKTWSELLKILFGKIESWELQQILENKCNMFLENSKYFQKNSLKYWIDKETRNSLFNLLNSLDEKSDFDLIVGDEIVKLPVSKVKKFLTALEQYASACKVQTLKHINVIKDVKNVEDLLKYDYTLGYPNQINLNDFI